MKYLLLTLSIVLAKLVTAQNYNIDSVSHVNYQSLHNTYLNGVWGYTDETGIEYALVGTNDGVSIVSLANPSNPQEIYWLPGINSIWREIRVYNDVMYVTTEAHAGLTIVDLSPLPVSTNFNVSTYTGAGPGFWDTAHSLHIDTDGGWAFINGVNRGNGGIIILDIHTDPMNPVEVGSFDNWYAHDCFAQGDKLFGAHVGEGWFSIIDISDHSNPILLNTQLTTSTHTHNIWATANNETVVTTDEIIDAKLDFYDVSDPMNIQFLDKCQTSPNDHTIPHNAYIVEDSLLFVAHYTEGVVIYDMKYPNNVVEIGQYDTDPSQEPIMHGCWGVYPYFSSGIILASDIQSGLFILQPTIVQAGYYQGIVRNASNLAPLENVSVKIVGQNSPYITAANGDYFVGALEGAYTVIFSKAAFGPDTVEVQLVAGEIVVDTIDLVPLNPLSLTVVVTDFETDQPIIDANVRVQNSLIDDDAVTDGFGEAQLSVYYPGGNRIIVGKWEYITHCIDTVLTTDNMVLHYKLKKGYFDEFSFDFGWTKIASGATQGLWERGVPYQSFNTNVPQFDAGYDCSGYCYITGNNPSWEQTVDDVEGGSVTLISPIMDLTSYTDPYVYFERYFFNWYGDSLFDDELTVRMNNSTSTAILDQTTDSIYYAQWEPVSVRILDFLTLDNDMKLIIRTVDTAPNSNITEAAFDRFMITEGSVLNTGEKVEHSWALVPNPTNGVFEIRNCKPGQLIRIYDILGKEIYTRNVTEINMTIDLSNFDSGVYVIWNNGTSKRLIVN